MTADLIQSATACATGCSAWAEWRRITLTKASARERMIFFTARPPVEHSIVHGADKPRDISDSRRLYSTGMPLESKAACGALALAEGIAARFAEMHEVEAVALAGSRTSPFAD